MIPADLEQRILRLHLVEKWPVTTIGREVGVHHTTVQRVLRDHGVTQRSSPTRASKADPFVPFIVEQLTTYPKLPASRLYGMVVDRGYDGSEGHFRRIVARYRPRKPAEAFLRLRTLPAEEAQMDWGHFGAVSVGRATRQLSAFVMVLSWSRQAYVHFFYDQRMASFLAGHVRAFRAFGGVPRRVLYDNLKSAVLSRRGDAIQFNPNCLDLASHYGFEPRPVAVARGNEKGRVERVIRYLRTSFWPARRHRDIADLNAQVAHWCTTHAAARCCPDDRTLTVGDAFKLEQPKLIDLPSDDFHAAEIVAVTAGKQPYIRFDRNDYSVPHDRVRRALVVHATPESVRVLDGSHIIATHERSYDRDAQVEVPEHLAALRAAKANARHGRGIDRLHHLAPNSATLLERAAARGHNVGSAVRALLRLSETHGSAQLRDAIDEVLQRDSPHPGAVRQVLEQRRRERDEPVALPLPLSTEAREHDADVNPHDLSTYDFGDTPS